MQSSKPFFEIEVNAFRHGSLIKNPRVLFTAAVNGEVYPMKYGSNEPPSKDHVDWIHMQVTGLSMHDQNLPDAPTITIMIEFFNHVEEYTKLIFHGKPGSWELVSRSDRNLGGSQ